MKPWFSFKLSVCVASLCVTNALLACGNVDPADNMQQAGTGGDGAGAGGTETGGGGGGAAGAPNMLPEGALLPWAVGNTWTYRVTKDGIVTEKVTTVGEEQEIGGTGPNAANSAFHVVTAKGTDGSDRTESWQSPSADNPERIVRYREQSFGAMTGLLELEEHWVPEKIHIDGSPDRTVAGASWLEVYEETKLPVGLTPTTKETRDRWTVIADDETIEVPAGVFEHVIHIQKTGNSTKEYWYLRGVGKLKETGTQTEELVDYTIEGQYP
jgi:hypothetical protein